MTETEFDADYSSVLVVNPLPWSREVSGPVSKYAVSARGDPADDLSARHWQDREINAEEFVLPPTEVPGYGYAVRPVGDLVPVEDWPYTERATVATDRYELEFDRDTGGIRRWDDANLDCQWVDRGSPHALGEFVLERLAETDGESHALRDRLFRAPSAREDNPGGLWNAAPELVEAELSESENRSTPAWEYGYQRDWNATRVRPTSVESHRVYRTPLGVEVRQRLSVPHLPGLVDVRYRVPNGNEGIVVDASWEMGRDTHPASTYLAFPFDIPDPVAHVDVGQQAIRPGRDQLSGSCHDYYTVQRWAELSNADRGVTVGCPLNPMVQFGEFHFGDHRQTFELERATLLGWTTTNFYNTNFRAHQPGTVRARYHLRPHDGEFDEARSHRVGLEAEHATPLVQPLAEPPTGASLEGTGTFLDLPTPPVLVTHVRPAGRTGRVAPPEAGPQRQRADARNGSGEIQIVLLNAGDDERAAEMGSGELRITRAESCGLLTGDGEDSPLPVADGTVTVELAPREMRSIRLDCAR
ncbi:hypothetical protein [Halomontanus rarus]|uniref:hypothetical protein n=1 Tax=Halomontanus rarus TaxID=3034020 RepID=UPI0023E78E64|nr:hypothetical protein [Halovivax sp. TS33]